MGQIRLDKFLTKAGAGSRSQVKEYIKKGRVTVNGQPVKKAELKVDEETDQVYLDGRGVGVLPPAYYLFHKPQGVVTAVKDNLHPTVMDFMKEVPETDLFPVGRLDIDTEGLLLITNDGPLAHFLLSPKRHVEKTYFARIEGSLPDKVEELFREGLDIGDTKPTLPAALEVLSWNGERGESLLTIREGRFHQVKRMFQSVGATVTYLKRERFGPLVLEKNLERGSFRRLSQKEIQALKESCQKYGGEN